MYQPGLTTDRQLAQIRYQEALREAADARERLLACLDKCIQELDMPNQRIITSYYIGREGVKIERRRELAESLGVTMNALAIRAYRIRVRLEGCVRRCVAS